MVAVSPCRSDMSARGLAPWAHLADGRLTLMLVRDCSRLQYLRFLAAIPRAGAPDSPPPPPPPPGSPGMGALALLAWATRDTVVAEVSQKRRRPWGVRLHLSRRAVRAARRAGGRG